MLEIDTVSAHSVKYGAQCIDMTSRRDIAIIGLGRFGKSLALELTRIGDRVLCIDDDKANVIAISGEVDTVVQADATDIKALKQLSLSDYDVVFIAIGENMQSSLVTTMNALELGCRKVWVKAQGEMHERILRQLGIEHIVMPEQHAGVHLAQMVHNPMIRDYLTLGEHQYVVQLLISEELIGQSLEDLKFDRHGLSCLALQRDGRLQDLGSGPLTLEEGDTLIVCGKRQAVREFCNA